MPRSKSYYRFGSDVNFGTEDNNFNTEGNLNSNNNNVQLPMAYLQTNFGTL